MSAYKHTNLVTYDLRNYSHGMTILIFWCIKRQIQLIMAGKEYEWNTTALFVIKWSFQSINIETNCVFVPFKVTLCINYFLKNIHIHIKMLLYKQRLVDTLWKFFSDKPSFMKNIYMYRLMHIDKRIEIDFFSWSHVLSPWYMNWMSICMNFIIYLIQIQKIHVYFLQNTIISTSLKYDKLLAIQLHFDGKTYTHIITVC